MTTTDKTRKFKLIQVSVQFKNLDGPVKTEKLKCYTLYPTVNILNSLHKRN